MNHIQLDDEFRSLLLEKTAWDKIGLDLDVNDQKFDQEDISEEAPAHAEEEGEQQLTEEEAKEVVVQAILDEAVENEVFFDLMERFAAVFDSASHINENYEDYDEDDVMAASIAEVFPEQFEIAEEEQEASEQE